MLHDSITSNAIDLFRADLSSAENIESVRLIEAQAAKLYWQAWSDVPIRWPRKDEHRVPEHWKHFGSRISPLTQSLASGIRSKPVVATRLTQRNKREVKNAVMPIVTQPRPEHVCGNCGAKIARGKKICGKCWKRETMKEFEAGRKLAQSHDAIAKRAETMLQHRKKIREWKPSDLPAWLTRDVYVNRVQPALASIAKSRIRSELGVSEPYSSYIWEGKRIPHPRHWQALARLAGVLPHNHREP
jgi:hypothetical protein